MKLPVLNNNLAQITVALLFLIVACQDNINDKNTAVNGAAQKTKQTTETVEIGSLDELMMLFDKLNYNKKSWAEGNREVPRLVFDRVSENWGKTSNKIPVPLKKTGIFPAHGATGPDVK